VTALIGWISGGSAVLLCDSAVTTNVSPDRSESAFGEPALYDDGLYIYEGAAKLQQFDSVLAGIVGDFEAGDEFLQWIAPCFARQEDLRTLVGRAAEHKHTARGPDFDLVIARHTEGQPQILRFRSKKQVLTTAPLPCIQGSFGADSENTKFWTRWLKGVVRCSPYADDQLVLMMATLQLAAFSTDLMELGVGGTFYGAIVSKDGVAWSADTTYAFCPPGLGPSNQSNVPPPEALGIRTVSVAVREGIVARWSNLQRDVAMLVPRELSETAKEWWESRWSQSLESIPDSTRYWTFALIGEMVMVIVDLHHTADAAEFVEVLPEGIAVNEFTATTLDRVHAEGGGFVFVSDRAMEWRKNGRRR
jgi:hypothetical protein